MYPAHLVQRGYSRFTIHPNWRGAAETPETG